MPSTALTVWNGERASRLNGLLTARSHISQMDAALVVEIDHALVLRLAAEFQGFARNLHDEAAFGLAEMLANGDLRRREVLQNSFVSDRRLDRGNATATNLAEDFKEVGVAVWPGLLAAHPAEAGRWRHGLQSLNETRNAVAHDEPTALARLAAEGWHIDPANLARWRGILDALAKALDALTKDTIQEIFGGSPW